MRFFGFIQFTELLSISVLNEAFRTYPVITLSDAGWTGAPMPSGYGCWPKCNGSPQEATSKLASSSASDFHPMRACPTVPTASPKVFGSFALRPLAALLIALTAPALQGRSRKSPARSSLRKASP